MTRQQTTPIRQAATRGLGGPAAPSAPIVPLLRSRGQVFWVKVAGMLLLGVPCCLVGPLFLGSLFWFVYGTLVDWVPWSWFFWGAVLVVLPLLFRAEIQTGGDFLGNVARDITPNNAANAAMLVGGELGMLYAFVIAPRQSSAGIVELLLFGPRLVVDAVRQIRTKLKTRGADLDRAAGVVAALLRQDQGVATVSLLRPGEQTEALLPTLGYLVFHDWVGVGDGGNRVWLLSDARRALSR